MPNAFSQEEVVAFEQVLEGFEDQCVASKLVKRYRTNETMMARANDQIWRPMPYILPSYDGMDQTANFNNKTQLSVPVTLGYSKSVPFQMDSKELRDALQAGRLGDAAKRQLSSAINIAVSNVASLQGTLVVKRTAAASGFDDVALCEAVMNEIGVQTNDRRVLLSTRDYNGMAGNLASRGTVAGKVLNAYDRAFIGQVASFDAFKADYTLRQAAATATGVTVNGANQYFTPRATSTAGTGERSNVDNRYQNLTITVGASTVKVGDCFTIAGVNAVHMETKADTGQLKTFRVISIVSGGGGSGVVQISPAIISNGGATQAELQYKNVSATPANGAAITFLNTAAGYLNPFWQEDAIELLPGSYAVPTDAGAAVMRASTSQGVEVTMQKWYDINTMNTKFRFDTLFGVGLVQPEMAGVILFSQP